MSSFGQSGPPVEHQSSKTLRHGILFFAGTCVFATAGYVWAGWGWIDAIYMVTITIFGVGYGEVKPIDEPGLKLFTMAVILAGCSSLIYVVGGIVQMLAEGEIEHMLGRRNRSREINQLSDHTIICGYGRVGQMLAMELANQGQSLVILDHNPDRVQQAIAEGFLALEGDAVDDDVLHQVGLFRARTLATVLPDDAINVFITLTARDLSDSIRIIARAESPCTERKLIRGGASSVVMPAAIGAIRIAQLATSPKVDVTTLPEDRYRMLHQQKSSKTESDSEPGTIDPTLQNPGACVENTVKADIEELAQLASNLSRSVIERHTEQLAKSES